MLAMFSEGKFRMGYFIFPDYIKWYIMIPNPMDDNRPEFYTFEPSNVPDQIKYV